MIINEYDPAVTEMPMATFATQPVKLKCLGYDGSSKPRITYSHSKPWGLVEHRNP